MENTVSLSFQYNFSVIFQIINPFWTFFFFHLSNFPRQMGIGIKKLMGIGSQTVCPSPVKMPRKTCNYSHSQFKHSCPTEITQISGNIQERCILFLFFVVGGFLLAQTLCKKIYLIFSTFDSSAFCLQGYVAASKEDALVKLLIYYYKYII